MVKAAEPLSIQNLLLGLQQRSSIHRLVSMDELRSSLETRREIHQEKLTMGSTRWEGLEGTRRQLYAVLLPGRGGYHRGISYREVRWRWECYWAGHSIWGWGWLKISLEIWDKWSHNMSQKGKPKKPYMYSYKWASLPWHLPAGPEAVGGRAARK